MSESKSIVAVTLLAAASLVAACGSGGGTARPETAALVRSKCTACHDIERVKGADHNKSGWTETVTRMKGVGADITDEQVGEIADFLANDGAAQL